MGLVLLCLSAVKAQVRLNIKLYPTQIIALENTDEADTDRVDAYSTSGFILKKQRIAYVEAVAAGQRYQTAVMTARQKARPNRDTVPSQLFLYTIEAR